MTVIASDAVKGRMLKIKFRELVGRIGGLEAAAGFCRVGKSTLARYTSTASADAECFAPIDVVCDLEALAGEPIVTEQLCTMADGVFVALPATPPTAGHLLGVMATLSSEFNDATRAVCSGLEDGNFDRRDAERLERELGGQSMIKMHLRATVPNEGARRLAWWLGSQPNTDLAFGCVARAMVRDISFVDRLLSGEVVPGGEMAHAIWLATEGAVERHDWRHDAEGGWFTQPADRMQVKKAA